MASEMREWGRWVEKPQEQAGVGGGGGEGAGREPWKFRKRNSVRIWALESDHFKFGQITHWNLSLLINKVGTQQDPRELAFSSKISG